MAKSLRGGILPTGRPPRKPDSSAASSAASSSSRKLKKTVSADAAGGSGDSKLPAVSGAVASENDSFDVTGVAVGAAVPSEQMKEETPPHAVVCSILPMLTLAQKALLYLITP
jgi:hypothetical protein